MNNSSTSPTTQGSQATGSLQPQASTNQQTSGSGAVQTSAPLKQDTNTSTGSLLNQGPTQASLNVVSAPFSSTGTIAPPGESPQIEAPLSGGISLVLYLLVIGSVLFLAAATAWNRYIKTPVPARGKRR